MAGTTLRARYLLDPERTPEPGPPGVLVCAAHDGILQRPVRITLVRAPLTDPARRTLRLQAQVLGRLIHPRLARLLDTGREGDALFLVSQAVDGPSYRARFTELDRSERLRVLAEVAEALAYVHSQGLIHGALRPGLIRLDRQGRAVVTGLDLALVAEATGSPLDDARSVPYASPESLQGHPIDHRADLYTLGILLHEAIADRPPFTGRRDAVRAAHVGEPPEPLRRIARDTPLALEALVLDLLAKDPTRRPATADLVADQLRTLLAASTAPNGTPSIVPLAGDPDEPRPNPARPDPFVELCDQLAAAVETVPRRITPEARWLSGHYLAYLQAGAGRPGRSRATADLDDRNAARARVLLALAALALPEGAAAEIEAAAALFEHGIDVRSRLSPVHVLAYLDARDTPARRRRFRRLRADLIEASPRAARWIDARGVLNPGLMPQSLADLSRFAPPATALDAGLVARWNALGEVWTDNAAFRSAMLWAATSLHGDDPAARILWPEVVDPLVLRALPALDVGPGLATLTDALRHPIDRRARRLLLARLRDALPAPVLASLNRDRARLPGRDTIEALRPAVGPASARNLSADSLLVDPGPLPPDG